MAESLSGMTNLRSLRLELGWFAGSLMKDYSEQLSSRNVWWPNLRSLIVSPPCVLEGLLKHCDHKVLKTLGLKGLFQIFQLEEAKKIKNLERLHLTFLKPSYDADNWSWTRGRPQLWKTLGEPPFSNLKWLTVNWEQEYQCPSLYASCFDNKVCAVCIIEFHTETDLT
jgi:hypothetical protein